MKKNPLSRWLRPALFRAVLVAIPCFATGCAVNYDAYSNPLRYDYDYCDVEGYDSQTSGSYPYGHGRYNGCDDGYGDGGGYGGW